MIYSDFEGRKLEGRRSKWKHDQGPWISDITVTIDSVIFQFVQMHSVWRFRLSQLCKLVTLWTNELEISRGHVVQQMPDLHKATVEYVHLWTL